jgi:hypothetical protein
VRTELEAIEHAAVDAVALAHALAKRDADQIALEVIAPLVVRAHERRRVAVRLLAELHATVRAAVLDDVDRAVAPARHDHLPFADRRALEVTRVVASSRAT